MGKKKEETSNERPPLPTAFSRFVGAWLGLLALALTYVAGVLSGVSAPTALLRAAIAWVVLTFVGRILGWFAGRSMELSLRAEDPDLEPLSVPVDAEVAA